MKQIYVNIHKQIKIPPMKAIKNTHGKKALPVGLSGITRYMKNKIDAITSIMTPMR
jgi:hypothetical protein